MAEATVRPARLGDETALAEIQLQVWQAGFAAVIPAELLAAPADALGARWVPALGAVVVALEGSHLVGFAQVNEPNEIAVLYVAPRWARRGHGGRLAVEAARLLRAGGAQSGQWWLPVTDVASQNFARSIGWTRTPDARAFETGAGLIRERRWEGTLDLHTG